MMVPGPPPWASELVTFQFDATIRTDISPTGGIILTPLPPHITRCLSPLPPVYLRFHHPRTPLGLALV
jgi:hypothetical protein